MVLLAVVAAAAAAAVVVVVVVDVGKNHVGRFTLGGHPFAVPGLTLYEFALSCVQSTLSKLCSSIIKYY